MTISFAATRLAPSPTGALHLGHARTFLITWWMARQAGAKIYMRMEDIDAGRAKPESVSQAYEDLRWLGMDWDAYEGTGNAVVQSERLGLYEEALQRLWTTELIYPCTCRRADILAAVSGAASAPHDGAGGEKMVRYPGTCAVLTRWRDFAGLSTVQSAKENIRALGMKDFCWRLRVPEGAVKFADLIAGPQSFDVAAETGDFPLTRFDGTPAYQLACVVDDGSMGIDLVIRGDDLLPSTPRQILLYRALGAEPPRFAHVPLVIGADGKRLAKRHGESRIAQFREAGVSAERVLGWVAWRSGQLDAPREISASEMIQKFDIGKLPPGRIVLAPEDLNWLTRPSA